MYAENKPAILFVDDSPNLIQGLQRALYSMKSKWDMHFADGGKTALKILETHPIDLVLSDMGMPEMNGVQLLQTIKERYPQTIRMILSGNSDQEMIRRAAQCSHQFLAKPSSSETLKSIISRAFLLRNLLGQPRLLKMVGTIPELPSHPKIYQDLMALIQNPDASIHEIGDLISHDPGMTVRVLQLVNSAYFGLPRAIHQPAQAIVYLGINLLKSLILMDGLFNLGIQFRMSRPDLEVLTRHSISTALAVREILTLEKAPKEKIEAMQTAALLHDSGYCLMSMMGRFSQVTQLWLSHLHSRQVLEAEYNQFGASHAELGAYLLGIWGLPYDIVEAVAIHHRPGMFPADRSSIGVAALHVAEQALTSEDPQHELNLDFIQQAKLQNRLPAWLEICKKVRAHPPS